MPGFIRRIFNARVAASVLPSLALAFLAATPFVNAAQAPKPKPAAQASKPKPRPRPPRPRPSQGGSGGQQQQGGQEEGGESADETKPLIVYAVWLKLGDTIALAYRRPAPSNRVVLGIARPLQKEDFSGHLYQIPGLKDDIPESALETFRAALQRDPQSQQKYPIRWYHPQTGGSTPFEEIEPRFIKYLHKEERPAGDLELWDVSTSSAKVRVAFIGDLALVQPGNNPAQSKVEDVLVGLLGAMALEEKKAATHVQIQEPCAASEGSITAVQRSPFAEDLRQKLRAAKSGGVDGHPDQAADNEFIITNNGWVDLPLRVEISPASRLREVQVATDVNTRTEIGEPSTVLQVPKCSYVRLSIVPRSMYEAFSEPVSFAIGDGTLTAQVHELGLRWGLIATIVLLSAAALLVLWWLLKRRRRPKRVDDEWFSDANKAAKAALRRSFPLRALRRRWAERRARAAAQLNLTQGTPTGESPEGLLRAAQQSNEDQRARLEELAKLIPQFLDQGDVQEEIDRLTRELQNWQETFSNIGKTPGEAAGAVAALQVKWATLKDEVKKLEVQLLGADPSPDEKKFDVFKAMASSLKAAQDLTLRESEYRLAEPRIIDALKLNVGGNGDAARPKPGELATGVEGQRTLLVEVLGEFAAAFQPAGTANDFNSQPADHAGEYFRGLLNTRDRLKWLEADRRVRYARVVTAELKQAARSLLDVHQEDEQYEKVLADINVGPGSLGEQLRHAALSSDIALYAALLKQAASPDGEAPGDEQVDKVLRHFLDHLLSGQQSAALNHMLRLWQIMEVYCKDSTDRFAERLYRRGECFRKACERLLTYFAFLDVRFHDVRFLEIPTEDAGWEFEETQGAPLIESAKELIEAIREKIDVLPGYEEAVADLNFWGFECALNPELSRKTELWRWRSGSIRSSES